MLVISIETSGWMSGIASSTGFYFPNPVDDFNKGVVGSFSYELNITHPYSRAIVGASQTRWCMSSKGIPWSFNSPLSNRLLLMKGVTIFNPQKILSDPILNKKIYLSEEHRLRTYFALVYPMVDISRWKKMSLHELKVFFCSLHWWYRGKGLPSPRRLFKY